MRHAKSDADKAARGTLRGHENKSEAARASKAISNVVSMPQMKAIPSPTIPIGPEGGPGFKTFHKWCDRLLQNNLLTEMSVSFVEELAAADQKLHDCADAGKMAPDKTLEIRRSMLLKLDAINVDGALVPDQGRENKYANNGYPAKLGKSPEAHKWRN